MKKTRVRINLDVSEDLAIKLKKEAELKDLTLNTFIRLVLNSYFEQASKSFKNN